jgi:NAD(P)-dependent dehydrogenase (short-subunit alcohol dehydrogenase family)
MKNRYKKLFDLSGKVAIITGSSRGIGASIAEALAEFGASVVISSRSKEAVDDIANKIRTNGYNALACECHVGQDDHLKNLIDTTLKEYGKIDILVNNAGINPVFDRLENADEKLFNKIMDINVKAAFKLSNMAMEHMKKNKSGSIINISSVEGQKPDKGLGVYSISKAAISMLTKSQAKEWGKYGIRSNAICPGLIKTKLSSALWQNEEMLELWLKDLPIRKAAEPEEISGLAVYLASEASSYTTGETFNVDGGYMIN